MTSIALVDDEETILSSVSLALESEGYIVDTYKNLEKELEQTKFIEKKEKS